MNTKPETSLTKAADPASVFIASTLDTSTGSTAFAALEKGASALIGGSIPKPDYLSPAAEAKDALPVATGDEDFTRICAWCGFMSHLGRGPVSHEICKICRIEFFPEVPNA